MQGLARLATALILFTTLAAVPAAAQAARRR